MEYIIFLITIQIPFLYIFWKFLQIHTSQVGKTMRTIKKQTDNLANFTDTLKLSVERISEDIYRSGKVNLRITNTEEELIKMKKQIHQMELYTGLSSSETLIKNFSSSSSLKEKDFS